MSKHSCLLSISVLASSAVACGSPHPSDIGADAGPDGAAIPLVVASNTVTPADLATGIAPLVIPSGATFVFDTDQGAMYDAGNGNTPIRIAGPGVQDGVFFRTDAQNRAFFAVQSVMLGERAILRGVGKRALILIAEGPVEIHGIIDVSAGHCSVRADEIDCAGPGGGRGGMGNTGAAGCSPGQLGQASTGLGGGGGGGGFASPGGAGGGAALNASVSLTGGAGGTGTGCPGPALDPLIGGSGGSIGNGLALVKPGGGGGGAVQVTSYTSIIMESPAANTSGVSAAGAGGSGGAPGGSGPLAGGGGGAGGAILLEAPTIDVHPGVVLAANGGGGGAGALAVDGQSGQFGATPASGGSGSSGSAGGAGAVKNTGAVDGVSANATVNSSNAGGGGGGGIGRIRINAIVLNVSDQVVLSPAPSTNILPSN